jgi:hypothetical protein
VTQLTVCATTSKISCTTPRPFPQWPGSIAWKIQFFFSSAVELFPLSFSFAVHCTLFVVRSLQQRLRDLGQWELPGKNFTFTSVHFSDAFREHFGVSPGNSLIAICESETQKISAYQRVDHLSTSKHQHCYCSTARCLLSLFCPSSTFGLHWKPPSNNMLIYGREFLAYGCYAPHKPQNVWHEVVFCLIGAYAPIIKNNLETNLKMLKILEWNFSCTSRHPMFVRKFSWKNNILCGMYRKDKKYTVDTRVGASKFVFFTRYTKNTIFPWKHVCEHRYLDICGKNYFRSFWHFKIYFHTMRSYAPMSRVRFPMNMGLVRFSLL